MLRLGLIISVLCCIGGSSWADPLDLTKPLTDLSGKPLMEPGPNPGDPLLPMSVGGVAGNCLAKEAKGPAYWALAQRLVSHQPVELTTAEIQAIKSCVDKLPAVISGQVDPAIDPTYKPEAIK